MKMRRDLIDKEEEEYSDHEACGSREIGGILDRRQQQRPNGCRDHDSRGKAQDKLLRLWAKAITEDEDTCRSKRCSDERYEKENSKLHVSMITLLAAKANYPLLAL